jgi:hypothetical protein
MGKLGKGKALQVDDENLRQCPQVQLLGGQLVLLAGRAVPTDSPRQERDIGALYGLHMLSLTLRDALLLIFCFVLFRHGLIYVARASLKLAIFQVLGLQVDAICFHFLKGCPDFQPAWYSFALICTSASKGTEVGICRE